MMATGGSVPSGSHMLVDSMTDLHLHPPHKPDHQRLVPRVSSSAEKGLKRTMSFLLEVTAPASKKGKRPEVARELAALEQERGRIVERIRKQKQRLQQQITQLQASETRRAEIDDRVSQLKQEPADPDADDY